MFKAPSAVIVPLANKAIETKDGDTLFLLGSSDWDDTEVNIGCTESVVITQRDEHGGSHRVIMSNAQAATLVMFLLSERMNDNQDTFSDLLGALQSIHAERKVHTR